MAPKQTDIELPGDPVVEIKPDYKSVDPKTVFLGGLFVLALLAASTAAAEIIMPIILAFILKPVLLPIMRGFAFLRVPRVLAALAVIMMLLGAGVGIGSALSTPAMEWASDLPQEFLKLKERLSDLNNPMEPIQKVLNDAQNLTSATSTDAVTVVSVRTSSLPDRVLSAAQSLIAGLFEMLLVLFFLLVSGDTFLRRLVEILPRFTDKKQAINISNQIERDISAYLVTITIMNAVVGLGTALAMWVWGVDDPLLWGIVAFLLNYVPIVGPIFGAALFLMVGLTSDPSLGSAMVPVALYLGIHITESQFITPFLLARHFTLNPVLVILGLIFFYWMWGIPGAILSTPIIAIIKIVCDNIDHLKPFGHFIEN